MKIFYLLMYTGFSMLFVSATRSLLNYSHELELRGRESNKFGLVWEPKGQSSLKIALNSIIVLLAAVIFVLAILIIFTFLEVLSYMI